MRNTINNRITHINIRGLHINFSTQCHPAIWYTPVLHLLKHMQIIFYRSVSVRIILTCFCQCSPVFSHLICSQR